MARLAWLFLPGLLLPMGGCALLWPAVPSPAPTPRQPGPHEVVFCYRTLADVACYDEIDRDRDGRLLGFYLRALDDPASKLYWLERARMGSGRVVVPEPLMAPASPASSDGPIPLVPPVPAGAGAQNPLEPPSEMPSRSNSPSP